MVSTVLYAVSPDLKTVTFSKKRIKLQNSSMSISGVTFNLKVQNIFVFTNGDVINLSENVTFNRSGVLLYHQI